MNTQPLVSIIIPTFNRAHLIGETLDSVLAQTYPNWECIVVDDGSTDTTDTVMAEYVERDSRFQYHHRPDSHKPGGNGARNYGFEVSKGEYIQWFDSDDLMEKDFLEEKMNVFADNLDFILCSGYYWNPKEESKKKIDLAVNTTLFQDYVQWEIHVLTPSVLFKESFLKEKTLFRTDIHRGQETEFFSRIFFEIDAKKYKIIDTPLFLYRQHPETKTHINKKYNKQFKESQAFINLENFKRSVDIENYELINYYYKSFVEMFFRALEHNHTENKKNILNEFIPLLKKLNRKIAVQFYIYGTIFSNIKKGRYRMEKFLKNKTI